MTDGPKLITLDGKEVDLDSETELLTDPAVDFIDEPNFGKSRLGYVPGDDKLTPKQQEFVNCILKGMNQSDAYRSSYDCENSTDGTVWANASRLFANSKVAARIDRGRKRLEQQSLHSAASLREHVIKSLYKLSVDADTEANQLKALQLLGQTALVQSFLSKTELTNIEQLSEEEVTEQLQAKLEQAFGT